MSICSFIIILKGRRWEERGGEERRGEHREPKLRLCGFYKGLYGDV
jgi:hypothetical protein